METMEIFASEPGVGQVLTGSFAPSSYQPAHPVQGRNRVTVRFTTSGTLPEWIEWKLETSEDEGATWKDEPATLHWNGTSTTRSRIVSTRPGTSLVSIGLPTRGCVRIVARRNGGGSDTTVLATAHFENVPPRGPRPGDPDARPVQRRDVWGRPTNGQRP